VEEGSTAAVIRGRFDTAIAFESGGYAVADFKTTEPA